MTLLSCSYPADVPDVPLDGRVQSGQAVSHQAVQILQRVNAREDVGPETSRTRTNNPGQNRLPVWFKSRLVDHLYSGLIEVHVCNVV